MYKTAFEKPPRPMMARPSKVLGPEYFHERGCKCRPCYRVRLQRRKAAEAVADDEAFERSRPAVREPEPVQLSPELQALEDVYEATAAALVQHDASDMFAGGEGPLSFQRWFERAESLREQVEIACSAFVKAREASRLAGEPRR